MDFRINDSIILAPKNPGADQGNVSAGKWETIKLIFRLFISSDSEETEKKKEDILCDRLRNVAIIHSTSDSEKQRTYPHFLFHLTPFAARPLFLFYIKILRVIPRNGINSILI